MVRVVSRVALALALLAGPLAAEAQRVAKVYRIGLLSTPLGHPASGSSAT